MWKNVIGHGRQMDALAKTLAEGRLPNAWLFVGMRGIGKRIVAEGLAAAMCCESGHSPCGECVPCSKVAAGLHPDVFVIEPEKDRIKIDQLRVLSQKVQFHPLEARAKVAIIDDADTMTDAAANSLLKILEEPPPATHFILVSASAFRLLPTIRSRCQRIAFSPLTDAAIVDCLRREEGWNDSGAARAASFAQGSLGLAKKLSPEFIDDVIGRFEAIEGRASAADIITTSEVWAGDATQVVLVLDLLAGWYRDRLRAAEMSGTGAGNAQRMLKHLGKIAAARDTAETTANKQLMFEQLLFSVTGT